MSVSSSQVEPRRLLLTISVRGCLGWMCRSTCRAMDWLCGDCQTRPRSQNKERRMKSETKTAKQESKTMVFIEVTGVIVAYLAIIASLAYPVVTAVPWGA